MIDEIIEALLFTHPSDRQAIRRYIAFVKFRRMMYKQFYNPPHWVGPRRAYHWVGK